MWDLVGGLVAAYPEDHAEGVEDAKGEHHQEDVDPEHGILERVSMFHGGRSQGAARTMGSSVMASPSGISCPWSPCALATDNADAASKSRSPGAAGHRRAMIAASIARCQSKR